MAPNYKFYLFSLFIFSCTLHSSPLPPLPGSVAVYISNEGPVADPTIAIDSKGRIYAAWWGEAIGEIFLSFSSDGGASWSEARNISNTPLSSDFPALAVGRKDRIYLVWEDQSIVALSGEIVFSVSSDGGETWSIPKNLSNTRLSSSRPALRTGKENDLYVTWIEENQKVFFTRSLNGGESWTRPTDLSQGVPPNSIHAPGIAGDDKGTVFVGWSVVNGNPFLVKSVDGGKTWSQPEPLTEFQPTNALDLVVGPTGVLFAVWSQKTGVFSDIFFAKSDDGGKSFSNAVDVSQSDMVSSTDPKMGINQNGVLFCVWHEIISGNTEIFMSKSEDQGAHFSPPINLSQYPGNSLLPKVALNEKGNLFIIWEQGVKEAIFFNRI